MPDIRVHSSGNRAGAKSAYHRIGQINISKVKTLSPVVNRSGALDDPGLMAVLSEIAIMNSSPKIVCSGLWQWLQGTGLERFEFVRASDEWVLRGTILTLVEGAAVEARYEIVCDRSFQTRRANVSVRDRGGERSLHIGAESGRWHVNGKENETVKGAIDIDLGWSPSTNTLPIRRLDLEVGGASGELVAAWVRFPDLTLQPLPQEYLRLADNQYRYSSRGGAFVAKLQVDENGLVMDYEGFWRRATAGPV
ncbi:MAG TPA: putative glycolipid-binding domain-containing protein [Candidatus Angelobacter sp.]